jgi:hypothetical protein
MQIFQKIENHGIGIPTLVELSKASSPNGYNLRHARALYYNSSKITFHLQWDPLNKRSLAWLRCCCRCLLHACRLDTDPALCQFVDPHGHTQDTQSDTQVWG